MQPNFFDLTQLTKAFKMLCLCRLSGSCSRQVQGLDVYLLAGSNSRSLAAAIAGWITWFVWMETLKQRALCH